MINFPAKSVGINPPVGVRGKALSRIVSPKMARDPDCVLVKESPEDPHVYEPGLFNNPRSFSADWYEPFLL